MSITTIVTFMNIYDSNGDVKQRYQNAKREDYAALSVRDTTTQRDKYVKAKTNKITFPVDNQDYYYLPFIYQGAAKNRSGDNLEAGLLFANNDLAMNYAQEAVLNKYYVEIFVSVVNPATLEPKQIYGNYFLTRDNWLAASMSYDFETIEIILSSSIDAVGTTAPNRRLTTGLVGSLPVTGDIQNR
tara:strand:+ start:1611 stop:2168 length:558 start_codon:yes stop_codon:yes gene_type:complete